MTPLPDFCKQEYPKLVGALDLYCGNLSVAEELAQDALAKVWRNWKRVSHLDNPSAWAHHVAMNLAKSHFRRLAAERRANNRLGPVEEIADLLRDRADELALRQAIARLPHRIKMALILRYFADLPFTDVARTMDVPEGTARSWVHRGLARLRTELGTDLVMEASDGI